MDDKDCLAGCAAEYFCDPLHRPGPAGRQAESFAPLVEVLIGGKGSESITVGNKSFPASPHTAVVKSYEVGWIDTISMNVEILDEAGGRFGAVVDSLRKCAVFGKGTTLRHRFGWTLANCENNVEEPIWSPWIESEIVEFDVNYSEGKIKYLIKCGNLNVIYEDMREDRNYGEDDKKVKIEEAIERLCGEPPAMNVQYCWVEADGTIKCGKFKWKKVEEVKSTWQADNQNRIATISKWIEPFRVDDGSEKGKGIVLVFDSLTPNTLILLRDPTLEPKEGRPCRAGSLGTFIVNGGKCSSVIEFSPTFNFIKGLANFNAGGGTSGPANTNSNFEEDRKTKDQEKEHGPTAGLQQQITITHQAWDVYGPKHAYQETMISHQCHAKANRITEVNVAPIIAELKILGDPRPQFVDHRIWREKPISIVAINPFHISGDSGDECGDWLAQPACNKWLSNKSWMVTGVNHSIKEGSYTTTLKVRLATPGIENGDSDPLGGLGSNGPTVKNTC